MLQRCLNWQDNDSHQDHGNLSETMAVHRRTISVMVIMMKKYAQRPADYTEVPITVGNWIQGYYKVAFTRWFPHMMRGAWEEKLHTVQYLALLLQTHQLQWNQQLKLDCVAHTAQCLMMYKYFTRHFQRSSLSFRGIRRGLFTPTAAN